MHAIPMLFLAFGYLSSSPLFYLGTADTSAIEITEWLVPWEKTRPRDPDVDANGIVWFVGQTGDYLGRLDPRTGEFTRFDLESGAGPHNNIVDKSGNVWYAGNLKAYIGKYDPATREFTKFPMPDPGARDPHTLVFDYSGDIWFTVQGGNFVGKLWVKSGKVDLIKVPTPRARPYGIAIDSEGYVWFNEFGSYKIGRVDPKSMELKEYEHPSDKARTRRIGITSDNMVWFVDYQRGYVGRLNPANGKFEEWAAPGGTGSRPYAMAVDDKDRIWFVEGGPDPNRLVGFDPVAKEFFSITEIKSGGGTVRHMIFDRASRQLWFGTDANTIGRAQVPK